MVSVMADWYEQAGKIRVQQQMSRDAVLAISPVVWPLFGLTKSMLAPGTRHTAWLVDHCRMRPPERRWVSWTSITGTAFLAVAPDRHSDVACLQENVRLANPQRSPGNKTLSLASTFRLLFQTLRSLYRPPVSQGRCPPGTAAIRSLECTIVVREPIFSYLPIVDRLLPQELAETHRRWKHRKFGLQNICGKMARIPLEETFPGFSLLLYCDQKYSISSLAVCRREGQTLSSVRV